MNKSKNRIYWIGVIAVAVIYWISSNNRDENNDEENRIFNENFKFVSEKQEKNFYSANFDSLSIDENYIHKIAGSWKVDDLSNEKTSFLYTYLEINDSIIFRDSISTQMTGWGNIQFKNSVKIYFSEYGSYIYEYLITTKKILRMIQYDYRDENLKFLEKPKPEIVDFKIIRFSGNILELEHSIKGDRIKLKKYN